MRSKSSYCVSLCGYVFEPYAIEVLEKKGGKFKCRRLVRGTAKEKPGETKLVVLVAPSSVFYVLRHFHDDQQIIPPQARY